MFSPYILLGVVLGSIGLGAIGYFKGDADAANRYKVRIQAMQIEATTQAQKIRDAMTAQANAAIQTLEQKNVAARVVYRTLTQNVDRIIDRPIYRDGVCLDMDGILLANAALGGVAVAPTNSGKPDGGMPAALTAQ